MAPAPADYSRAGPLPRWMTEPPDYPPPGKPDGPDPFEVMEAEAAQRAARRLERRSRSRHRHADDSPSYDSPNHASTMPRDGYARHGHRHRDGTGYPSAPESVVMPPRPTRHMDYNSGINVDPRINLADIPRPSTMIPLQTSPVPIRTIHQAQRTDTNALRIYGPAASPRPAESSHSRHRATEKAVGRPRTPPVPSPKIYANYDGTPKSSSRHRAGSQPPPAQRTAQAESSSSAVLPRNGMYKRKTTPVPMMYTPDAGRVLSIACVDHPGVCVRDFLQNPRVRMTLVHANRPMPIEDAFTSWRFTWPGYHEEIYSLGVGKRPTYDKVVEALCRAVTKFIEGEESFRDQRQVENLKYWRLGRGGIGTDKIWIGSFGECQRMNCWVSNLYVDFD